MNEILSALVLLSGAIFTLLAAVGILRMPDIYMRMSAVTKASAMGVGSMLLAAAIYFSDLGIASRALATLLFLLLTAPIAAHRIGRAAYFVGVPLWDKTLCDELKGRYDERSHILSSEGPVHKDA